MSRQKSRCRPMRLRSMLYCSCLSRQSWARASPLPGKSSSPSAVTENTSKSVPYASNAIAFMRCPPLAAASRRLAPGRAALEDGQDDLDHVLEHRAVRRGLGHHRQPLGAAREEAGEGPQVLGCAASSPARAGALERAGGTRPRSSPASRPTLAAAPRSRPDSSTAELVTRQPGGRRRSSDALHPEAEEPPDRRDARSRAPRARRRARGPPRAGSGQSARRKSVRLSPKVP